jgi:hypothetical protein
MGEEDITEILKRNNARWNLNYYKRKENHWHKVEKKFKSLKGADKFLNNELCVPEESEIDLFANITLRLETN